MARLNKKREPIHTHEGAKAKHINPELQLKRSVMSYLLWEREFYEDGEIIADRIKSIIPHVNPQKVAEIAIEARSDMKLRHVPLLIAREMARLGSHKKYVSDVLAEIIQRPDELTEFLAIYWKDKRQPLSKQLKLGLARAFPKFNEYSLAKYNKGGEIKLRDVLFLCHAKPKDKEQDALWKRLIDGTLAVPDTWEVGLSGGGDKKEVFERLLKKNKLGALALLRNLRNMEGARVDENIIIDALNRMKVERVLPFRFISAARYAPQLEPQLEKAMLKCLSTHESIRGHTVLLLDVSGSMEQGVSSKSDITRLDAACGVAMLLREICEKVTIFTFSMKLFKVPPRHGFALRDAIVTSQEHSGTPLGEAVKCVYADRNYIIKEMRFTYSAYAVSYQGQGLMPDRLIVITDEQSCDSVPDPQGKGYMINVASARNGVGYGAWIHIDGWSEAVINYVIELEKVGFE